MSGAGRLALVTGGAGFIGSHIVDELVANDWRVRVLDDFSSGRRANLADVAERVEVVRGDITDAATVDAATAGADVVFHEAAIPSVPRCIDEPLHTDAVNVRGTLHVLEAARKQGVRRVLFASSCAIYGNAATPPVSEAEAPDPISPYAVQKLAADQYMKLYTDLHGLETVSLRYFNVYGARQDPRSDYAAVVPRFVTAAIHGEPLRVHGDGQQSRDFVHVLDVARANRLAADAAGAAGGRFNVASGRGTKVSELADVVASHRGQELEVIREAPRAGDVRESWADVNAAREVLGFEAEIDLTTGIRRTVDFFAAGSTRKEMDDEEVSR